MENEKGFAAMSPAFLVVLPPRADLWWKLCARWGVFIFHVYFCLDFWNEKKIFGDCTCVESQRTQLVELFDIFNRIFDLFRWIWTLSSFWEVFTEHLKAVGWFSDDILAETWNILKHLYALRFSNENITTVVKMTEFTEVVKTKENLASVDVLETLQQFETSENSKTASSSQNLATVLKLTSQWPVTKPPRHLPCHSSSVERPQPARLLI